MAVKKEPEWNRLLNNEYNNSIDYDLQNSFLIDNYLHVKIIHQKNYIVEIYSSHASSKLLIDVIVPYLINDSSEQNVRIGIESPDNPVLKKLIDSFFVVNAEIIQENLVLTLAKNRKISCSLVQKQQLVSETRNALRMMRSYYFKRNSVLNKTRSVPLYGKIHDGMPTESLGPFPEFILPTFPCKKTLEGYCTPCFFSKVEKNPGSRVSIYNSLFFQTKYIVDNFEDVVLNMQCRQEGTVSECYDVTLCIATNGSFFSDYETDRINRYRSLELLADEMDKRKLNPLVYIESCVDDYCNMIDSGEIYTLLPLLQKLNAVILVGFESCDEFVRDVLYAKDLILSEFERIVGFNEKNSIATGAFLYRGFHSLTQNEIIQDTVMSLLYLRNLRVMPVIMLPNLQEYTLTHCLYINNRYNVLEPITALSIIELTIWFTKNHGKRTDAWLMGDLFGGPPAPKYSVFTNPKKVVCDKCGELIRKTLQYIRMTGDTSKIDYCKEAIMRCECSCYKKYETLRRKNVEESYSQDVISRASKNIRFFAENMSDYLKRMETTN